MFKISPTQNKISSIYIHTYKFCVYIYIEYNVFSSSFFHSLRDPRLTARKLSSNNNESELNLKITLHGQFRRAKRTVEMKIAVPHAPTMICHAFAVRFVRLDYS